MTGRGYLDRARAAWGDLRIWDYLRYDEAGDLWVNDLRVVDAVRAYGTPLEIVDTRIVEARARAWRALAERVAAEVGYDGGLGYLYAAKANMAAEVTHAAYRSGWHAETSSGQDLANLEWLEERGLLPAGLRVVCNGFKLPLERLEVPDAAPPPVTDPRLLPDASDRASRRAPTYAERILRLARAGWDITPVLDAGELEAFTGPRAPDMAVGLRLKFGKVRSLWALEEEVSRFGQDLAAVEETARLVAASPNLRLTMLHAMAGAAETIPVDTLAESVLLAGRLWARLRAEHPTLRELNMGGGMPPLGEAYDHAGLLRRVLSGLSAIAREAGVPEPTLTFELGSCVAAEAGFHAFKVLQRKANHVDRDPGTPDRPWLILDGGLMAAIPDMLLIGKAFRFLPLRGALEPAIPVLLGDLTCDSDGRYPPDDFGPEAEVFLPDLPDGAEAYVLIQGVGAYQEILAGVGGAHHCGLLEAVELILERGADGVSRGRLVPRQTQGEAMKLLGYRDRAVAGLRATVGGATEDPPTA